MLPVLGSFLHEDIRRTVLLPGGNDGNVHKKNSGANVGTPGTKATAMAGPIYKQPSAPAGQQNVQQ